MSKKELIVQAAIEAFKENGVHKTTIADIVKRAGIAQGTFYLYFPSKWDLMPSIAEIMVAKMVAIVESRVHNNADYDTQLRETIAAIFEATEAYKDVQAIMYAGLASTEQLNAWEQVYEPIYEKFAEWLIEAQQAGFVRSNLKPNAVAKLMIGLIETAAEQIYLYDANKEAEAQAQQSEVYELLIRALTK